LRGPPGRRFERVGAAARLAAVAIDLQAGDAQTVNLSQKLNPGLRAVLVGIVRLGLVEGGGDNPLLRIQFHL
jgi:hypothetical protein